MNNQLSNINVYLDHGVPVTSSRDVAKTFEKNHRDILRDIRNILTESNKNSSARNFALAKNSSSHDYPSSYHWFFESTYTDSQNKVRPEYILTREGFSLLAMGFTGDKALQFKIAYIRQFNHMETKLKNLSLSFFQQEKNLLLKENKKLKYKAEFYDAVTNSPDTCNIETVAKTLGFKSIGRNNLYKVLRDYGILNKNNLPYQKYIDAGYFTIDEEIVPDAPVDSIRRKLMVFQKGVDFILRVLLKKRTKAEESVTE